MIPDEIDAPHAVVRVLEEAGIEFVFGMPGGDTGRIFDALYDSSKVKTVLVRHEQVGSIMAEMYGRLTGKPGVVMGQGIFLACNALFGTLEAVKGASPMLLLGDFTDMAPFQHHAPYQAGTGEHGNHDLRNLLASATKYTAAASSSVTRCAGSARPTSPPIPTRRRSSGARPWMSARRSTTRPRACSACRATPCAA